MTRPIDPLVVALVRTINSHMPNIDQAPDEQLVGMFGRAAQPLADGLRDAIRDEVTRQLEAVPE